MKSKILQGDALLKLKEVESDSVDCIVTDPPYGYSFMGKNWDKAVPHIDIWKECLRVLKAGGFAFVMSAPRQDTLHRMIKNLEDAGFYTGFTSIYWTYATGFPKAMNISKAVDKKKGVHPEKSREFAKFIKEKRLALNIGLREIDEKVCNGSTNYSWFEGRPAGQRLPRLDEYNKIKDILKLDGTWDNFIGEAERKVIGMSKNKSGIGNNVEGHYTVGGTKAERIPITESATDIAKELDGAYAGYQPKPAVEIIIVVMKPLSEKSYVNQAMMNQKGVTWLDDCRIPFQDNNLANQKWKGATPSGSGCYDWNKEKGNTEYNGGANIQGRFPSNLLISDDILNDGVNHKSSDMDSVAKGGSFNVYGKHYERKVVNKGSNGSYSRFFDLDKWVEQLPFMIVPKASKSERNMGCENLPIKEGGVANQSGRGYKPRCAKCGKQIHPSKEGSFCSCEEPELEYDRPKVNNHHPTVKPIKLMSYLITLGSREGDLILDPFCGSGTTGIAALNLHRRFLGVELNPEYVRIAEARIKPILSQNRIGDYNE